MTGYTRPPHVGQFDLQAFVNANNLCSTDSLIGAFQVGTKPNARPLHDVIDKETLCHQGVATVGMSAGTIGRWNRVEEARRRPT